MNCKCGSETTTQTHPVLTLQKGQEWCDKTEESDLPLKIHQWKCKGCGRLAYKVQSSNGGILKEAN